MEKPFSEWDFDDFWSDYKSTVVDPAVGRSHMTVEQKESLVDFIKHTFYAAGYAHSRLLMNRSIHTPPDIDEQVRAGLPPYPWKSSSS